MQVKSVRFAKVVANQEAIDTGRQEFRSIVMSLENGEWLRIEGTKRGTIYVPRENIVELVPVNPAARLDEGKEKKKGS